VTSSALYTMLVAAAPLLAQAPREPAADLSVRSTKVPGLEVRFVDYHWQPAIFEAMVKGSRETPEARRDWVIARVIVEPLPLKFEGVPLSAGSYALSLFPNKDGKGMAVELRRVDMRELYPKLDAMAPTPPGDTMYRAPATFEVLDPLAPRLDIAATEDSGAITLTVSYGDRRLALKLTR
jgi:hypothetical protein